MAAVWDHVELDFRPLLVQIVGRSSRANDVVATLGYTGGNMSDLVDVLLEQQLAVRHPAAINKEVRLDP
jgi:hypothetical protein